MGGNTPIYNESKHPTPQLYRRRRAVPRLASLALGYFSFSLPPKREHKDKLMLRNNFLPHLYIPLHRGARKNRKRLVHTAVLLGLTALPSRRTGDSSEGDIRCYIQQTKKKHARKKACFQSSLKRGGGGCAANEERTRGSGYMARQETRGHVQYLVGCNVKSPYERGDTTHPVNAQGPAED